MNQNDEQKYVTTILFTNSVCQMVRCDLIHAFRKKRPAVAETLKISFTIMTTHPPTLHLRPTLNGLCFASRGCLTHLICQTCHR